MTPPTIGCTKDIEKELPQWRVEGQPLFCAIEAWGCVPFEDVVLAMTTIKGKVDRLTLREAPGWSWE